MMSTLKIAGAISVPLLSVVGWTYRRFRRTASNEIESFWRYLTQGVKYYIGRYVRRRLAAELTLKQYARVHLRGTATEMSVPATFPVALKVDDVFVPLLLSGPTGGTMEYHDLIERSNSRVLIVGEPGSGKSSLMKRTFRDACRRANVDPRRSALPILFELRKLALAGKENLERLTPEGLFNLCVAGLSDAAVFKAKDAVAHLRQGPGYLILLDGLDEVPSDTSSQVVRVITRLSEHLALTSPRSSLVVSTRTQHYLALQDRQFRETFEARSVRPFSIADVYKFLLRWPFDPGRNPRDEITRMFSRIRQLPSLTEMCTNPLALAMFVARDQQTGGAISPETRSEFYASLVKELLVDRRLRADEDATGRRRKRDMLEGILGPVCLAHLLDADESANSVPEGRLLAAIEVAGYGVSDSRTVLSELSIETGLFSEERESETYRFLHLTLCEFLAAREVVNEGSEGWRRVYDRLCLSSSVPTIGEHNWTSRLAEIIAFACGIAPRALRLEILDDLLATKRGPTIMRAVIEAQSYDNPAVLTRIGNEGEDLAEIQPTHWDEVWFSRLRWLIAVLRDAAAGSRPGLVTSNGTELPSAAEYLMRLIDRYNAENRLLATLARDDAEAAVAIAESAGRPALLEIVAGAADDFSVLQGILARCDAGQQSWKQALVGCALRRREIADVLVASQETGIADSRAEGWSGCFVTRGSVYGGLLDDVLRAPHGWTDSDRALLEPLSKIRPPKSYLRTALRATLGGVVTSSTAGLRLATAGTAVVLTLGTLLASLMGEAHKNLSITGIVVFAAATVALLVGQVLWLGRRRIEQRSRVSINIRLGVVTVSESEVKSKNQLGQRLDSSGGRSPADRVVGFWRRPVLEEVLNLARFRFASADTRVDGEGPWQPGPMKLRLSGVRADDMVTLTAARELRAAAQNS